VIRFLFVTSSCELFCGSISGPALLGCECKYEVILYFVCQKLSWHSCAVIGRGPGWPDFVFAMLTGLCCHLVRSRGEKPLTHWDVGRSVSVTLCSGGLDTTNTDHKCVLWSSPSEHFSSYMTVSCFLLKWTWRNTSVCRTFDYSMGHT